jgi:monoamine oxidase
MAKSALLEMLRRAYKIAQFSRQSGMPTDEVLDRLTTTISRRRLLQGGLAVSAAMAATALHQAAAPASVTGNAKVLIVGGGIAGLTAAYRLTQSGVPVDLVEAQNHLGGRIRSLAKAAGTQTTVELGGEFIDTDHACMLGLVAELGLQVADLSIADTGLLPYVYFFNGRWISLAQVVQEFMPLAPILERDAAIIANLDDPAAIALDRLSITAYLTHIQASPLIKTLLEVAYNIEYGREANIQSCLNLLILIGTDTNNFQIFGSSDERYHVIGGNAQVPKLLAQRLSSSIETGTELEAIRQLSDGRYRVSLRSGYRTFDRTYERILLTIPFSVLREVRLAVDLPPRKRRVIEQLSYGTNAKLITAYRERTWRTRYGSNGEVFTDLGFQNTWEPTRYAPGAAGLLTNFTGGKRGLSVGLGSAEDQAQRLLPQYERVFPGIKAQRQGQAIRAAWSDDRYVRGSYACYLVGDWQRFSGEEGKRVGNLFFAGEHCSQDFQGYMEGGCATGTTAAEAILQDLAVRQHQGWPKSSRRRSGQR